MFVKVNKPLALTGGNNKGNCTNLMNYLDKENEGKETEEKENFFNHDKDKISKIEAEILINGNNKRLGKDDVKFYMFSINPSWREQKHLEGIVSKTFKEEFNKDNPVHLEEFEKHIKSYSKEVMNVYADAFTRRDSNGKELKLTSDDLVYAAKLEKERTYKLWEKEVLHNKKITKKVQELKEGLTDDKFSITNQAINNKIEKLEKDYFRQDKEGVLQKNEGEIIKGNLAKTGRNHHVHVVVSRQTSSLWYKGEKIVDGKGNKLTNDEEKIKGARPMKLSPQSNSKGTSKNHKLNGKEVSVGFNHEKFKTDSGEKFNEKFDYKSSNKEKYTPKESKNKSVELVKGTIQGRVQGKIKEELRGEVAKTEEKIFKAMVKPVSTIKGQLKQKILEILKGSILEK